MSLKGKVAIVTGGNSGIGKAIALGLAQAGASIVIDYVADPEATEALEREILALGDRAIGVDADVSRVADLQRLFDAAVAEFGRVDIMVNNAGVETRTSVLDTTEAQYDKVLSINLKSAFFGTQLAAQQMIKQGGGGRIINITSVHEDWPMPGNTAYCLSKGGMRMLTRTAGVELAPHGILVVGVGPGAVATPINLVDDEGPGAAGEAGCRHPARAHGQAGGDRECRGVPCRRRGELRDGDHDIRRWRYHAEQSSGYSATMTRAIRRHHHRQWRRRRHAGAPFGGFGQEDPHPRAWRLAAARGATTGASRMCSASIATSRPTPGYCPDGKPFQPQVHYFVGGATKVFGAALYRLRKEDFGEIKHHDGISPAWPIWL